MDIVIEPTKEIDALASKTIGAALEVHKLLGPGYLESIDEEALCIEFESRKINFHRQPEITIQYKGHSVGGGRMDLVIEDQLIVELKTVESLLPIHKAQVISYLKATKLQLGLLINFNGTMLKHGIQRVVYSKQTWRS